jgi:hypothetical protein
MNETWEVLEIWKNPNRYNPDKPEEWWVLRRREVPGGWIYQARTLLKVSSSGSYFYEITSQQMSITFVPNPNNKEG